MNHATSVALKKPRPEQDEYLHSWTFGMYVWGMSKGSAPQGIGAGRPWVEVDHFNACTLFCVVCVHPSTAQVDSLGPTIALNKMTFYEVLACNLYYMLLKQI